MIQPNIILSGIPPSGVWNVYLRMEGVRELFETLRRRTDVGVLERLYRQPYGETEFLIKDPNGYTLVLSSASRF